MPIKVLFIDDDSSQQNVIKNILSENLGVKYHIIDSFELLETELATNNYTHIVTHQKIKSTFLKDYSSIITIPVLILVNENFNLNETSAQVSQLPLNYSNLFSFLCATPILAFETLEKYAMGDPDFINQVKELIIEEFEDNVKEMPQLIENKDLKEIKSKTHQMVSKFSLLEMNDTFELSKEIDLNILDDPEKQLLNVKDLLIDVEIALTQLK